MIVMQSMELDDEDKLDAVTPLPMADKPDFPYGLKICITEKELRKLKLDASDAVVGGTCHGHFMARITCFSAEQRDGDDCYRIEMQIEELAIESEDAENEGK